MATADRLAIGNNGSSPLEKRRDTWIKTSFIHHSPANLWFSVTELFNVQHSVAAERNVPIVDEYLNRLEMDDFVEGIHVTVKNEGFNLEITLAKVSGKDKYQNRKKFAFKIGLITDAEYEELARLLLFHFRLKPLYLKGSKTKVFTWNEISPNDHRVGTPTEHIETSEDTLLSLVEDTLRRGQKVSLNRVPLILHQDDTGERGRWFVLN